VTRVVPSTDVERESHLIRCQTRDTISPGALTKDSPQPLYSISQVSTLTSSFADDVRTYAAGGLDAIGIWETKLAEDGHDGEAREQLEASGLGAASAVPTVPSVLPLPLLPGPDDPQERIEAVCASIHRLAAFGPTAIVCLTGPAGERDTDDARAAVVAGLRTIAAEAERAGMRMALEPFQREGIEHWSLVNTIPEAVELIDEVGSPAFGIQFDIWHLWNTPDLLDHIETHIHRFAGVHVNDWREPTRGWADRALPGDGAADVARILGALDAAGWGGYYDLEIFSDNGAFGTAYPDSLWDADPAELVRRSKESFVRCWQERRVAA
jgi:sugar phosphate isomerase/epimerase